MPSINVLGSFMYYREYGSGPTLLFLHGNPASSHLWRNVIPGVEGVKAIAPDLIGMGRSGKPDIDYQFVDHARYLDSFIDDLALERLILVGHDWGGALALDWAARHPDRVDGVAFLEAIIKPLEWADLSPQAQERSRLVRASGSGEQLVLTENAFLCTAFAAGVLTPVPAAELADYLEPYPTPESRRPILAWARQMPLGGEPVGLVTRIEDFDRWLVASPSVPKLLMTFSGSPTLAITPAVAAWCAQHISGLDTIHCGEAGHHAPEDRPAEISGAISQWLDTHHLR